MSSIEFLWDSIAQQLQGSPARALWKQSTGAKASACRLCKDNTAGKWLVRCSRTGCNIWFHASCCAAKVANDAGCGMRATAAGGEAQGYPTISFLCPTHNESPLYCSCQQPDNGDEQYIQCSVCAEWCHYSCEGVPVDEPAPEVYTCKACQKRGGKAPAALRERNIAKSKIYEVEVAAQHMVKAAQWIANAQEFVARTLAAAEAGEARGTGGELRRAEELMEQGEAFKMAKAGGEDAAAEEDAEEEPPAVVPLGMQAQFKAQLEELSAILQGTTEWQERLEAWQMDHQAAFWTQDNSGGGGQWAITEEEMAKEAQDLEEMRAQERRLRLRPPNAHWLNEALEALAWTQRAHQLVSAQPPPPVEALAQHLALAQRTKVANAFNNRAFFAVERVQFVIRAATIWQKRARQMLGLLAPARTAAATIRLDQLRQQLTNAPDVPVALPEREELRAVIQFWMQWEAEADAVLQTTAARGGALNAPLSALADADAGAALMARVAALLDSAAAQPRQVRCAQRETLSRMDGWLAWAQRAAEMLARAGGGGGGNGQVAAPPPRRADFQALLGEGAKQGLSTDSEDLLMRRVREAADGGPAAAHARALLAPGGAGGWNAAAIAAALDEIAAADVDCAEEAAALRLRLAAVRWRDDAAALLGDGGGGGGAAGEGGEGGDDGAGDGGSGGGGAAVSLEALQALSDRVAAVEGLDEEMDEVPLYMKLMVRLKAARKWQKDAAQTLAAARTLVQRSTGTRTGTINPRAAAEMLRAVHTRLSDLAVLRVTGAAEETELQALLQRSAAWTAQARARFAAAAAPLAEADLQALLQTGPAALAPPALLDAVRWRLEAAAALAAPLEAGAAAAAAAKPLQRLVARSAELRRAAAAAAAITPGLVETVEAVVAPAVAALEARLWRARAAHVAAATDGSTTVAQAREMLAEAAAAAAGAAAERAALEAAVAAKVAAEGAAQAALEAAMAQPLLGPADVTGGAEVAQLGAAAQQLRAALQALRAAHAGLASALEPRAEHRCGLLEWCARAHRLCGNAAAGELQTPLSEVDAIAARGAALAAAARSGSSDGSGGMAAAERPAVAALAARAAEVAAAAQRWSAAVRSATLPHMPETPEAPPDAAALPAKLVTGAGLGAFLRDPVLALVQAPHLCGMICEAMQGATAWEQGALARVRNESTTQEELSEHLKAGGAAQLPAGLGAWAVAQWAYEAMAHAARVDDMLSGAAAASPRLPYAAARNAALRARALLWPDADAFGVAGTYAPGPLTARAVKAYAAATGLAAPPPPQCAAAALRRLLWISDVVAEADAQLAQAQAALPDTLAGGREAAAAAVARLEAARGVQLEGPLLQRLRAARDLPQGAAAAAAALPRGDGGGGDDDDVLDFMAESSGGEGGGEDDEVDALSDGGDAEEDAVDTSRGVDDEYEGSGDETPLRTPQQGAPPLSVATRESAAAAAAASGGALLRIKLPLKGVDAEKAAARAAAAAAAADGKPRKVILTTPFGRALKPCKRCRGAHTGAVRCRIYKAHHAEPDFDAPDGATSWSPPQGFAEWYETSEKAREYRADAAAQAAARQQRAVPAKAATPVAKPKAAQAPRKPMMAPVSVAPRDAAQAAAAAAAAAVAPRMLRPECLGDGCKRVAAQDSAYCSDRCKAESGAAVLRALRGHRAALGGRWSHRLTSNGAAAAAAAGSAPVAAPSVDRGRARAAVTAARAALGLTADGAKSAAAVAAPKKDAVSAAAAAALQRLASGEGRDKFYGTRVRVRQRFEAVFVEGMAYIGQPPNVAACQLLAWDLESEIHRLSLSQKDAARPREYYKEKQQMLRFNLTAEKNPELFVEVVAGDKALEDLCGMTATELAPQAQRQKRQRMLDESVADHWIKEKAEDTELVWDNAGGGLMRKTQLKGESKKAALTSLAAVPEGAATGAEAPPLKPPPKRTPSDASIDVSGVKKEGGLKRQASVDSLEEGANGEDSGAKRVRRESLEPPEARRASLDGGKRRESAEPSKVLSLLQDIKVDAPLPPVTALSGPPPLIQSMEVDVEVPSTPPAMDVFESWDYDNDADADDGEFGGGGGSGLEDPSLLLEGDERSELEDMTMDDDEYVERKHRRGSGERRHHKAEGAAYAPHVAAYAPPVMEDDIRFNLFDPTYKLRFNVKAVLEARLADVVKSLPEDWEVKGRMSTTQVLAFIETLKLGRRTESAFFLKGGRPGTADADSYEEFCSRYGTYKQEGRVGWISWRTQGIDLLLVPPRMASQFAPLRSVSPSKEYITAIMYWRTPDDKGAGAAVAYPQPNNAAQHAPRAPPQQQQQQPQQQPTPTASVASATPPIAQPSPQQQQQHPSLPLPQQQYRPTPQASAYQQQQLPPPQQQHAAAAATPPPLQRQPSPAQHAGPTPHPYGGAPPPMQPPPHLLPPPQQQQHHDQYRRQQWPEAEPAQRAAEPQRQQQEQQQARLPRWPAAEAAAPHALPPPQGAPLRGLPPHEAERYRPHKAAGVPPRRPSGEPAAPQGLHYQYTPQQPIGDSAARNAALPLPPPHLLPPPPVPRGVPPMMPPLAPPPQLPPGAPPRAPPGAPLGMPHGGLLGGPQGGPPPGVPYGGPQRRDSLRALPPQGAHGMQPSPSHEYPPRYDPAPGQRHSAGPSPHDQRPGVPPQQHQGAPPQQRERPRMLPSEMAELLMREHQQQQQQGWQGGGRRGSSSSDQQRR